MKILAVDVIWCKGCGLCIEECNRLVLGWSGDRNDKGHSYPQVKNADNCINCECCVVICPELAISLEEV
jgi:2-oxoglutarate ferredoxin oxidoreductase subunit delta